MISAAPVYSAAPETTPMANQRKNEEAKNALAWGVSATKQVSKCAIGAGAKMAVMGLTSLVLSVLKISPEVSVKDQTAQTGEALTTCISSVAIGLAKDQIVKITKSTFNWINTGLGGDSLYVSDISNLLKRVENGVVDSELSVLRDSQYAERYPYGRNFASSQIQTQASLEDHMSGLESSLFDALTVDNDAMKAVDKLNRYKDDFSMGGWNGWISLTQNPQNNPLGFNMLATDKLALQKEIATTAKKDEVKSGGGVLDKKECVQYGITKKAADKTTQTNEQWGTVEGNKQAYEMLAITKTTLDAAKQKLSDLKSCPVNSCPRDADFNAQIAAGEKDISLAQKDYDAALAGTTKADKAFKYTHNSKNEACQKYETVTPGSVIKDQVSKVIQSPMVQLELVNTLDDALGAVLDNLMGNLQDSGIKGIDKLFDTEKSTVPGMSLNSSGELIMGDSTSNGSRSTGGFDLKDLGNKYTEVQMGEGNWSLNADGSFKYLGAVNERYTTAVTDTDGTKHVVGDYKTYPTGNYILEKRGVIQIQADYITAANKNIESFKNVMSSLGELDYCIPGPNPNWEQYNQDVYSELQAKASQSPNSTTYQNCADGLGTWIFWPNKLSAECDDWNWRKRYYNTKIEWEIKVIPYILSLYDMYKNQVNSIYGPNSKMLDNKTNSSGAFSSDYLPMASAGQDLTAGIVQTDANVTDARKKYLTYISEAKSVQKELAAISAEYNKIIDQAQKDRITSSGITPTAACSLEETSSIAEIAKNTEKPLDPPSFTIPLTASPSYAVKGSTSTLSWETENTDSCNKKQCPCTINGQPVEGDLIPGAKKINYLTSTPPIDASVSEYAVSCIGNDGSTISDSILITSYEPGTTCASYGGVGTYPNCTYPATETCTVEQSTGYTICQPKLECKDLGAGGTYPDCIYCEDSGKTGTYPDCKDHITY